MLRSPRKIRILMTGGGTGGHIYPLVAVSRALSQEIIARGLVPDIRYFGDAGIFRSYLDNNEIRIAKIASSKMRRYFDIQNLFDIFKFFFGFIQGIWKIYFFMPDAAFSKGGPGALAVIKACRFYRIPVVIHESDIVPALTTRLSAKSAEVVDVAFQSVSQAFDPKKEVHVTGNPIREEILRIRALSNRAEASKDAKASFGFNPENPLVLIIGGSQGAERLNNFVLENIFQLAEKFQILHQVGAKNFQEYKRGFDFTIKDKEQKLSGRYNFVPYFEYNLDKAYIAADLLIGRAGANTIFEVAALGIPSILIPFPESANNHQLENAYAYAKSGGALVIEEENLLPGVVISETVKILEDRQFAHRMSEAAKRFFVPNSAQMIAGDVLGLIKV